MGKSLLSRLVSRSIVLAFLLTNIGFLFSNIETSTASEKLKVTALLIQDSDRARACKGSFTEATVDYAIWKKERIAYYNDPCLIKVISNKPLSGTQYLQIRQGTEWVDICSLSFWAKKLSKLDCAQKFDSKENLGKVSGKSSWICTFKNDCLGTFDYSTPNLGRYTQTEGDSCIDTSISNLELRIRVASGTKQYFSNLVKFSYVNSDKVIYRGGKCELDTSPSSPGKLPGQDTTGVGSGTSLPQCNVTQIRQHSTLAKEFNSWRKMYLDSVDLMNESINGMNKASSTGNRTAYEGWAKNLKDSTDLARSTANEAISTQNKLITLMKQCAFNYGVIVTQPFGFITTDENFRGYQFPTFQIP